MFYEKDLVFLDLEWLTFKGKRYITQIGIIRLDKNNLSIKKQRLFKIRTCHFNNFQLGLIGCKTNHDKGTVTINKNVVRQIYDLLNDSIIHIYFDPNDIENDDLSLLLNNVRFEKVLSYQLVKIYTKWSLRHLYANLLKQKYISNPFHNALEDALMLKTIFLEQYYEINHDIPFYEYCCNYELFSTYWFNKDKYKKIVSEKPKIIYKISNLNLEQNKLVSFEQKNIFFHQYNYSFDLTNTKNNKTIKINNQNVHIFLELIPQMFLLRDKVSTSKLEKVLQTIFVENDCFLMLLTKNFKN